MVEMCVPWFFGSYIKLKAEEKAKTCLQQWVLLHGKFNTDYYEDQMKISQICIVRS